MLIFTSCGGGSSKQAKELLQRILNLVGIPQEIVVNICQNQNRNSICEDFELQAKIKINRGDDIETIISKITKAGDGKYFLETLDPTIPLLLILQDIDNLKYNNGKFNFHFNGLAKEQMKKELSILESMIDAGYLTQDSVKNVRNLNSIEAQNRFYDMLLKVIEENQDTLGSKANKENMEIADLIMSSNLMETANRLLRNGIESEFPNRLNSCNEDLVCIDGNITNLYNRLRITPDKAEEIYINQILSDDNNSLNNDKNDSDINYAMSEGAFITNWKTNRDGISKNNQIHIPTDGVGYNYSIDWGDGTYENNITGDKTHTYENAGIYTVRIFGKFPKIAFGKGSDRDIETVDSDARKLINIIQWGDINWKSMEGAFMECTSLESDASDVPNLSNVNSTKEMFYGATSFNSSIENWNVSNITDMSFMFAYAYTFNRDISSWEVGSVEDMNSMFKEAKAFNQNLGSWNIKSVKNMEDMFYGITLSTENYDSILIGWSEQNPMHYVNFNAGDSIYSCNAKDARDRLISILGWNISDGGTNCINRYIDDNNEIGYKYKNSSITQKELKEKWYFH
jgi:surface protein